MKAPSPTQRLYWQSGGDLLGFGGFRMTPDTAESLRNWYLSAATDFGVETDPGQYCIRAARELREAMTAAGQWSRASAPVLARRMAA